MNFYFGKHLESKPYYQTGRWRKQWEKDRKQKDERERERGRRAFKISFEYMILKTGRKRSAKCLVSEGAFPETSLA